MTSGGGSSEGRLSEIKDHSAQLVKGSKFGREPKIAVQRRHS
jgi:hypothetical protein